MLLYTKRNKLDLRIPSIIEADENRRKSYERIHYRRQNPLDKQLRTRLAKYITLVIESGQNTEPFLLIKETSIPMFFLNEGSLRRLSMLELGYDLSKIIDCRKLEFRSEEYSDIKFFDLIELLVIFAREDKRSTLVERLQAIFDEEDGKYIIHDFMITKVGTGLNSVTQILQDKTLQSLVEDFEDTFSHIDKARISAGIIQRLFSSADKSVGNKKYAEDLCERVADKWTDRENKEELKKLLSETVKNAKALVNQITNIRHTDKLSIQVEGPSFYKLISQNNMAIAELVILSLPENFVIKQKASDLKEDYLKKEGIDRTVLEEVDESEEAPIDLKDIPF